MMSNVPPKVPLKFEGGSFEPIKIYSIILFAGSLTGSESEIHIFDQVTEEV